MRLLKKIFTFLFGSFHWQLPMWLNYIVNKSCLFCDKIKRQYKNKEPRFFLGLASLLLIIFVTAGTYVLYISQPKPLYVTIKDSGLKPTPLTKDAKPDSLWLMFSSSAAQLDDLNKDVTSKLTMSPPIKGKWGWRGDKTLVFKPKTDWPVDQTTTVKFAKNLFPSHVHLETDEYEFSTPKFTMSIANISFYQSPENPDEKKIIAEVNFSHPVNTKAFENNIKLTLLPGGKDKGRIETKQELNFSVTYDDFLGKAYIHSKNIKLPNYESIVDVQISSGTKSSFGGNEYEEDLSKTQSIPGKYTYFTIKNIKLDLVKDDRYQPEQIISISTSAPIKQSELSRHIEVYALPKDKPAIPGIAEAIPNYRWLSPAEINKDIINQSTKLEITPIPTELEYANLINYKYKQDPGKYLYVRITGGAEAFGGYILPANYMMTQKVPKFPTELSIMSEGSILSLSGEKKLPIMARNIENVKYSAKRLLPKQISHLLTQSNGNITDPKFARYNFNWNNISETYEDITTLANAKDGTAQYSHFDFNELMATNQDLPRGLFYFTAEGWDVNKKSRIGLPDSRFLLITDLGIISKKASDESYDIFIQSISSGTPVGNAKIEVIGKNGLAVVSQETDLDGHANIPNLKDFKNEEQPIAFVVTKDNDLSFLPISNQVINVNYSKFDIGGVRSKYKKNDIEGYLFSDRGIYRPGDKINIGYLIKSITEGKFLENNPIVLKVKNPRGQEIISQDLKINRLGFDEFSFSSQENWPTGRYWIAIYTKKDNLNTTYIGSTEINIEEFLPDRMKITTKFSKIKNKGWVKPDELKAIVSLKNLFGTPAQDRNVKARMKLIPAYHIFNEYQDWQFYDPLKTENSFDEELESRHTDKDGNAEFDLNLDKYENASFIVNFTAEGFEAEGGRSVSSSNSILVSPLGYIVGYKAEGSLSYIKKDSVIGINIIALDSKLNKTSVGNLTLKTIKSENVSTLVKQPNGTFKYETVKKEQNVASRKFSINNKQTYLSIDTTTPGDFALVILDQNKTELNRINYSIAGKENLDFAMEKDAELNVKINKTDYKQGEEIELNIRAPYIGSGLITIERDKVYTHKWFNTTTTSTIQKIKIPDNIKGNAYVNVTFVRSINSDEIFMSPFSTAVVPFSINKENLINKIKLDVPDLVRPGGVLDISISTKKPGKAIIFAVNEGILQVANYQTPDPINNFYKKRALEVETKQILDLILPEFSKLYKRYSSEAGGMKAQFAMVEAMQNLNPFKRKRDKAVVFWSGLIDVDNKTKTVKYVVPDYFNGQLRVMAVAVSENSMDATSKPSIAKSDFVLSPNVPNFIAPDDKFTISLGVSNNAEGSGKDADINVKLLTSENIEVTSNKDFTIKIDEGSEKSLTFDIKAKQPLGNAVFTFVATHKDKIAKRTVSASVRPANPYITTLNAGKVKAHTNKVVQTPRKVYKDYYENQVAYALLPTSIIPSLSIYLSNFSHGCTEQLLSKAIPNISLAQYNFDVPRKEFEKRHDETIALIASRQIPSGGIVQWSMQRVVNPFHTVYAAHYLTEAKDFGFNIPKELMESILQYLKSYSELETSNLEMARVQAYASYILARNGIIVTKSLNSLEKWLTNYESKIQQNDIMTLYRAASYKLMLANKKAKELIDDFDYNSKDLPSYEDYSYGVFDDAIRKATYIYIISKHFPESLDLINDDKLNNLVDKINEKYNTTSSALSILALQSYAKIAGQQTEEKLDAEAKINNKYNKMTFTKDLFPQAFPPLEAEDIKFINSSDKPAYYALAKSGYDTEALTTKINNNIEVSRTFFNQDMKEIDQVNLGDEIYVKVTARSLDKKHHANIAILDLLPGGFEVVLDSIERQNELANYVDVREDRAVIYGNLNQDAKTYTYKIKATNKGHYTIPPIYAKSMYDNAISSTGITQKIIVK